MCRCVLRGLTTLCGCALLVWNIPAGARAYEDQVTLGVGAGYANAVSESLPANGVLVDLAASVGLTAVWSLRGRISYAQHPAEPPLHIVLVGAELLYLIDVVEVVPYFGLGVDAMARMHIGADVVPAAHAVVGADYLLSREFALGLDVRANLLPTELDHDSAYIAAIVSATWMFER